MKKVIPHALVDNLLHTYGLKNDRALAGMLKISSSVISKMRKSGNCSDAIRLSVMRVFKMPLTKIDVLAPPAE